MTRFIAFNRRSYDTWRMRFALTLLLLTGLALTPARSDAFDIEQSLKELHVQYQGEQSYHVAQRGCTSLSQAIESVRRQTGGRVLDAKTKIEGNREVHYIKVMTKDGKVKTRRVNGCSR
ncbi:MAG: PepSY domain-containing protein [Woeseiaceae bacterium]